MQYFCVLISQHNHLPSARIIPPVQIGIKKGGEKMAKLFFWCGAGMLPIGFSFWLMAGKKVPRKYELIGRSLVTAGQILEIVGLHMMSV